MVASCHQVSGALAAPDVGFPAAVLDPLEVCCEAQLPLSADRGGRAVGPGPCDQSPSGMGVPGFGARALVAPLTRGICRRDQFQALHELSGSSATGEIAHVRHHGDGHGAWHTTQGLEGLNHRVQTPRVHVLVQCLVETLEAFGVFGHRADVFLQDDWLSRCGTHPLREPPERGRAPVSPAGVAAIGSAQEGFEATLGVLAIAEGLFARPREITHGLLCHLGARDRGEIA
jgi:hypothetical protein